MTDVATRFSTTNSSSPFLTFAPGIKKTLVSSSGTGPSHAHFKPHTTPSLHPVLTLNSAMRAKCFGNFRNNRACSSHDREFGSAASVTFSSLIFGGVASQVRLFSSSHSEGRHASTWRTNPSARLIDLALRPCFCRASVQQATRRPHGGRQNPPPLGQSASRISPDARLGRDECNEDGGTDSDALAYTHCGQFTA